LTKLSEYRTVEKEACGEIIEKKSKFIANVKPVKTENEAVEFINSIKSKYWDARHNVYAYVIGNNNIQRYSDDGEPSGTAGIPTLEVIKQEGLIDIVIVTTRYFGGTLLGAGGLVRAYSKSAKEGIIAAGIITNYLSDVIRIKTDYNLIGKIQNEIENMDHKIENIVYEQDVTLDVLVNKNFSEDFIFRMVDLSNGKVEPLIVDSKYVKK
jgi:uncharacterized YigZ family protein